MSLRAIPLTIIPLILYNLIVLFSGSSAPDVATDGAAAARALLNT
jgi:hypothetical protein